MGIKDRLKEKISEQFHSKVDEITILDEKEEYSIEITHNKAKFIQILKSYKSDDKIVYTTNISLVGEIELYPIIQVNGDFAIVLLVADKVSHGKVFKENKIVIYEIDPRLIY